MVCLKMIVEGWWIHMSLSPIRSQQNTHGTSQLPFIRPHSGAFLRQFARNHFSLRSMPQLATWTAVYIPQPLSTFIRCALPHSRPIWKCWSNSLLISNLWIKCHIPHSVEHPGRNHHASLHSGGIPSRRCDQLYFSDVRLDGMYPIPLGFPFLSLV